MRNEKPTAEVRAVREVAKAVVEQAKVAEVVVEAQTIGATTMQKEEG